MRYPCGVGHMAPFVCAGTKGPEMDIYISCCPGWSAGTLTTLSKLCFAKISGFRKVDARCAKE